MTSPVGDIPATEWWDRLERHTRLTWTEGGGYEAWRDLWDSIFYHRRQVDRYERLQGYQWDKDGEKITRWDNPALDEIQLTIMTPLFFGPLREDGSR